MLKQIMIRFPWLAQFLGPIAWAASLGWLAIDLCGPAFRKTIPIMLTLGLVALRDGPAEEISSGQRQVDDATHLGAVGKIVEICAEPEICIYHNQ